MSITTIMPDCEMYGKIRFFKADRCINTEALRKFNKNLIQVQEIVSFDTGLFEMEELEQYTAEIEAEQLILLMVRPDVEKIEKYQFREIESFEFCGYDLVEFPTCTSAITNCGGMFGEAIEYSRLNQYGLFSEYLEAVKSQIALREMYPEESHAYCEVIEIWRKCG